MNDYTRRTAIENEVPGYKSIGAKGIGFAKSRTRPLENVENLCKTFGSQTLGKSSAIERQRANAERLTKGYSVVTSKENVGASNACVKGKEARGKSQTALGSLTNLSSTNARTDSAQFKVPAKPSKPRKPLQTIQKCVSVTSLVEKKEIQEIKNAPIPIALPIIDEDSKYENDPIHLGAYVKDIYAYLRRLEKEQAVRERYLTRQHLMTDSMRSVLVDWMYEVQQSFDLLHDTTQIAIATLDRFLQNTPRIPKDDLQLVGVTCICIASKYEEMYPPTLTDLVQVSANACTKSEILRMEKRIFKSLEFSIGRPPPSMFLRRFCRVGHVTSLIYALSKYFVDLALVQYTFCHIPPSQLAAAALYLALYVMSEKSDSLWSPTLVHFTCYNVEEILPVVRKMATLVINAPKLKQQSVQQMYAGQKKYSSVSTMKELTAGKLVNLTKSAV